MKRILLYSLLIFVLPLIILQTTGCANIVPPSGGLRDSIPPVPVHAVPKDSSIHVQQQKLTITFDEYIELKSASENVLISPYPVKQPVIESKLRTLTVRLKDSLLPNTTYSIDFGNAIVDLNEGNVLKNFRYSFSTGAQIDNNELTGRVVLAETGKTDSTMFALLYTKQEDSTVFKEKPKYVARVNAKGNFHFTNLPEGSFYVYALKDIDGDKKYNQLSEQFAFLDSPVIVSASTKPVKLYAFAVEKERQKPASTSETKGDKTKTLRSTNHLENGAQDILDSFRLVYQKPVRHFDSNKIELFIDSVNRITNLAIKNDSVNKQLIIYTAWKPGASYKLFLNQGYATDSSGLTAVKNDTISFRTKTEKEYGSIRVRFKGLDTSKHPVLLFYSNDKITSGIPVLNGKEIFRKLFKAGNYQLAILYDTNQNGLWDTGDFFSKQKRQPEIVQLLSNTLTVKENWDNELVIDLNDQQSAGGTKPDETEPQRRNF